MESPWIRICSSYCRDELESLLSKWRWKEMRRTKWDRACTRSQDWITEISENSSVQRKSVQGIRESFKLSTNFTSNITSTIYLQSLYSQTFISNYMHHMIQQNYGYKS